MKGKQAAANDVDRGDEIAFAPKKAANLALTTILCQAGSGGQGERGTLNGKLPFVRLLPPPPSSPSKCDRIGSAHLTS